MDYSGYVIEHFPEFQREHPRLANVKKKVGQCWKKTRPPALEKTRPLRLEMLEKKQTTW